MQGVRRRGERLARNERGKVHQAAVRPHPDLQPAPLAGKHPLAEVQGCVEQPVDHRHRAVGDRPGDEGALRGRIVDGEEELVASRGGLPVIGEPPLVRESRAHRLCSGEAQAPPQQPQYVH